MTQPDPAPKEITPAELDTELLKLPSTLWKLNNAVVTAHLEYMRADAAYDNARDKAYIQCKAEGEKRTSGELEALAEQTAYNLRLASIVAQAAYERAKNDAECCDKKLSALQSIVKLRSSEMRAGLA